MEGKDGVRSDGGIICIICTAEIYYVQAQDGGRAYGSEEGK